MAGQHHAKLAAECASHFERQLVRELPGIADSLRRTGRQSSFTVTVECKPLKQEGFFHIAIRPRVRTPIEPVEMTARLEDRQLSLFVGDLPEDDEGEE